MFYKKSQVSNSQKPTLRKGLRKHLAQGQVARARDLRKQLAQALAQAACASEFSVCQHSCMYCARLAQTSRKDRASNSQSKATRPSKSCIPCVHETLYVSVNVCA